MSLTDWLRRTNFARVAAIAAAAALATTARADVKDVDRAAEARLRADVTFLADDAREGRAPGTAGIEAAAEYIAASFRDSGLKPAAGGDGFFQPFPINGPATLKGTPTLAVRGAGGGVVRAEVAPLAIGIGGALEGVPVVFAGYGITAKDLGYDDYGGIDAKGKAVLIVRRTPQQARKDSPFEAGNGRNRWGAFQHKATNAFQHGAAAVLMVNDAAAADSGQDTLLAFTAAGTSTISNVPYLMTARSFADQVLATAGAPNLRELEAQIDADGRPHSRELPGATVTASVEIDRATINTKNVVGVLEGEGPLADETVVVGAHYDHLGRGGLMSGSLAFMSRDIHNGADDNASGTATVLELARRLGKSGKPLPRRVVFMAYSGEEKGLLGSQYYVDHPLYPLDKTAIMLNFDMVGRLGSGNELIIFGLGSSAGLEAMVDAVAKDSGLAIKKNREMTDGQGGSDHQSFYQKQVPVLFFFTGVHTDYHRPSDDSNLINYAGMARIADLGESILLDSARRPRRPEFAGSTGGHGGAMSGPAAGGVYLGTIPDYGATVQGAKLSAVIGGGPAEKAGLKGGDVVVSFGGKPVGTISDYTESLYSHKPGDEVEIVVNREGKEVTLKATLDQRPGR